MTILIVAAHPDDEVLGCGGTIAKLSENNAIYVLILGEGITSRDISDKEKNKELNELKKQSEQANKLLGTKKAFFNNFPDNKFDTVPLLDIVKSVEKIKRIVNPDIIFTHSKADLNVDHRITYQAVLTATRPIKGESVKALYSFEVLSSTEWNFPSGFAPNVFIDITDTLDTKLKAMNVYKNEIRDDMHPRSLRGIITNSQLWGLKVGLEYAEAFELVRNVK